MTMQEVGLTQVQALAKRTLDVLLSVVFLVLTSPLMLVLAAATKASGPGPVIYKYRRLGPDGSEVYVYRFRTMRITDNGAIVRQATRDDPRITPLGKFMRRTALDELPAFLNVLAGHMSIVGPRPKHQAEYEYYQSIRSVIVHAKPGITSTSRGYGYSSTPESVETIKLLYEQEVEYVQNWSLWVDLRVIVSTVQRSLFSSNAY
jgi:putative colanic acid biosynthesis UDP-glucose lipid carrier transferase